MSQCPENVAILIPCYNEQDNIARCLDSLIANDYPHELLDIVIVDGLSTDNTREIISEYDNHYEFIRLIDNAQRTKSAALNLGVQVTESDIIIRIDAHATYASNYISKLVEGLHRYKADNIGGIRETAVGETAWEKAVSLAISHPFAAGNAVYRTGAGGDQVREVDTVFCGCYRRSVFQCIGGFHPDLLRTQDREFNARLVAAGGKIVLDPSIRCCYYPRTHLIDYMRWVFQGAYWVHYADRFTTTQMRSWRNQIPSLFLLWQVLAVALGAWSTTLAAIALVPLVVYLVLVVLVSSFESLRHRSWPVLLSLIVLFPVTHYAYGLGALSGKAASWLMGAKSSPTLPPTILPASSTPKVA